jgi:ribonuclease P protein component
MPERNVGAFPRARRLRKPEQFAAAAGDRATWRASRQLLAASARVQALTLMDRLAVEEESRDSVDRSTSMDLKSALRRPDAEPVRFGFTVSRRQARRAVQRALVKRVLREAARNAAGALRPLAADRTVDVVLRLRSPLPGPSEMSRAQLKRSLRTEADSLIGQLARHLRSGKV